MKRVKREKKNYSHKTPCQIVPPESKKYYSNFHGKKYIVATTNPPITFIDVKARKLSIFVTPTFDMCVYDKRRKKMTLISCQLLFHEFVL